MYNDVVDLNTDESMMSMEFDVSVYPDDEIPETFMFAYEDRLPSAFDYDIAQF